MQHLCELSTLTSLAEYSSSTESGGVIVKDMDMPIPLAKHMDSTG